MLSVQLYDMAFYSFHGIYPGESKIGNNYQVNVTVNYDETNVKLDDIRSLINYEELFDIIKRRMAIPSPLMEEVAEAIIIKIKHQYRMIKEITVSIFKLQPPIESFQGKVGITLHKQFED